MGERFSIDREGMDLDELAEFLSLHRALGCDSLRIEMDGLGARKLEAAIRARNTVRVANVTLTNELPLADFARVTMVCMAVSHSLQALAWWLL